MNFTYDKIYQNKLHVAYFKNTTSLAPFKGSMLQMVRFVEKSPSLAAAVAQ